MKCLGLAPLPHPIPSIVWCVMRRIKHIIMRGLSVGRHAWEDCTWTKNSVEYLGCAGGSARSAQAASSSGVGDGSRALEVPIAFFFPDHVGGGENSRRPPRLELYYRIGTTQCCGSTCGADQSSWKTGTPSCSHALDPGPQGLGIDVPL